jgi:hypothetical protein
MAHKFSIRNVAGKIAARIDGVVTARIDQAASRIQSKVRKEFLKSSRRGASRPGQYPRAINKHAANSIRIRRKGHHIQAGYYSRTPRYSLRLRGLADGATIKPGKKSLAIPLSWEARVFASNAKTAAQGSPRNFKPPGGGKLEVIPLKSNTFLGVKQKKGSKKMTGTKHRLHFLLTKRKITREPRLGLTDAFNAHAGLFVKLITADMQKELTVHGL